MPVFLGYDQTERMIAALLDRAAQWQPDAVVGIARGGLVPATMAAGILALPLAMIGYERASGASHGSARHRAATGCCLSMMAAAPAAPWKRSARRCCGKDGTV